MKNLPEYLNYLVRTQDAVNPRLTVFKDGSWGVHEENCSCCYDEGNQIESLIDLLDSLYENGEPA